MGMNRKVMNSAVTERKRMQINRSLYVLSQKTRSRQNSTLVRAKMKKHPNPVSNQTCTDVYLRVKVGRRRFDSIPRPKRWVVLKNRRNQPAPAKKKGRKWYEASEAGRKAAGEVTLTALVNSLDREQPGLVETQRRLSGVLMKHGEAENKKPKFKILKNPVLIQDPFYILPEKLLDACMKLLPVSNTANHAISIYESQHSQDTGSAQLQGSVETIWIKHVGNFSRAQIETFKRVHNLMEVVKLGLDTHKWLVQEGIPSLPAEYHAVATSVADEILSTYPRRESRAFSTSLISSMRCSTEFLLQHGYQMPQ
ncbi:hypothetical protein L914_11458 [Phytophthora nicotianae]|uniref:Uncharacterized protein n=1 Tax=Phytophthora nicotianae TaxID=4792 RepID=W2N2R7_PHYNI|nr:hypothetical protein L914_11458 [Phytophthora nicotianae]